MHQHNSLLLTINLKKQIKLNNFNMETFKDKINTKNMSIMNMSMTIRYKKIYKIRRKCLIMNMYQYL